jgi:hypothetical protein
MKTVYCDCCKQKFDYGEDTGRTDGLFVSQKVGLLTVRVCLSVKAVLQETGDHADICPICRKVAIEKALCEPIS